LAVFYEVSAAEDVFSCGPPRPCGAKEDRAAGDAAFAEAMRDVVRRFPNATPRMQVRSGSHRFSYEATARAGEPAAGTPIRR